MRNAWAALLAVGSLLGGCASANQMAPIGAVMASTGLFANPEDRARLEKRMTDRDIAEMLDVKV